MKQPSKFIICDDYVNPLLEMFSFIIIIFNAMSKLNRIDYMIVGYMNAFFPFQATWSNLFYKLNVFKSFLIVSNEVYFISLFSFSGCRIHHFSLL